MNGENWTKLTTAKKKSVALAITKDDGSINSNNITASYYVYVPLQSNVYLKKKRKYF